MHILDSMRYSERLCRLYPIFLSSCRSRDIGRQSLCYTLLSRPRYLVSPPVNGCSSGLSTPLGLVMMEFSVGPTANGFARATCGSFEEAWPRLSAGLVSESGVGANQ
eukprot:3708305-Pleurochrysis_carterae.AAC.1